MLRVENVKRVKKENNTHGRLVDADALLEAVNEQINVLRESQNWNRTYGAMIIRDMIITAPTVRNNQGGTNE